MKMQLGLLACFVGAALCGPVAVAQDGVDVGDGQTLLFTQDTATGFGNAVGGGQDSAGGSEINAVYGDYDISSGTLNLGITGNLEGNFNKLYLFFDAVAGGENVLDATNTDGGFNEIQNMAGLTFDAGFTADHGLRFEIGDGFWGANGFTLLDDSSFGVASGGGPTDLPLASVGSGGVTIGWDNSNVLGIDEVSAADALTATTGFELSIDAATFFGEALTQNIGVTGFVTSADAGFLSNQVIGGIGGGANLEGPAGVNFSTIAGNQFVTVAIPEPSSFLTIACLAGGSVIGRRRRRRLIV